MPVEVIYIYMPVENYFLRHKKAERIHHQWTCTVRQD